ncbi:MAG: DUF819 family protein [Spirobacillus cienkowskii]|jgi:uncharacterized membrane protein|uniref:DUF819 family protein n=1 Tax=Spirobacillus cienkowskii TaxID=495820 RepID=A0A369KRB2_9BACT|nr:MAG: DUF819 family protein [Spirobacillus cienkowskii]
MDNQILLLVIFGTLFLCFEIEKKLTWVTHVSSVCLVILVAMLLSQIKIIPSQSEVYDFFQGYAVLIGITLMILNFNIKNILKINYKILIVFLFGLVGSLIGGVIAGYIAHFALGDVAYKLAALFTATYIGGLDNAAAMQKMYNIPETYFTAAFTVDNIITSLWVLVSVWLGKNINAIKKTEDNTIQEYENADISLVNISACLFMATFIIIFGKALANKIGFFHSIIWITLLAIIVGQIPIIRKYCKPAYVLGATAFALFFFSVGATVNFNALLELDKIIILMPIIVVFIHAIFIFLAAKMFSINKKATIISSQALIGGPGTAIAVAQAKHWEEYFSTAIILGVLGYTVANFLGAFVFNFLTNI